MIDLSKKRCAVLDHGLFLEVALRLARDVGTVYYVDPAWEDAFSKIDHAVIGDGYGDIIRVAEIWDVLDKVDFCVFPDVHNGSMQEHIAEMGMPVWGGRNADELELHKLMFRELQRKLGMEVPEYDVVKGLDALREFCKNPRNEDRWVKTSPQFRGNRETFHHENYQASREILDAMGCEFGIIQDCIKFIVEHPIKADLESGLDTYTVDGLHPDIAIQGYECKDKSYLGAVQPYSQVPKEITCVSEYLWPLLRNYGARQFISSEVKITDDKRSFLLEPTIRMASPAGEPQLELYENFSEIIYGGAKGVLVQPEVTARFVAQAMLEHHGNDERWRSLEVPDHVRQWVKLYSSARVSGVLGIAPGSSIIGSVLGLGDTPAEALAHLKHNVEEISDCPVSAEVESIAKLIVEIEEAEEEGISFTRQKMPKPAEVLPS